ncbi:ParA family protein [Candidatus Gracilibacteria bacterium]|nr:ParA family protein [Candidatus Gracilibacteria bacterium]
MIIQIKVQKGGIGKSFITANLGGLLAKLNKKTIILTTDLQNSVYSIFHKESNLEIKAGLKRSIKNNKIYSISLRENLDYIPLTEELKLLKKEKIHAFFSTLKENYEYILIDSTPTINIDDIFLEISDKIIIPANGDKLTIEGVINIIKKEGNKISCIVFNKFNYTSLNKKYYEELTKICKNTNILVPKPIPQWSYLNELVEKSKVIWESKSKNKKLDEVQSIFLEIFEHLLEY